MSALSTLLDTYRQASITEREKGTYFEELIACYLRNEITYHDLYSAFGPMWTGQNSRGCVGATLVLAS